MSESGSELRAGQDVAISEAPTSTGSRLRNALIEVITTVVLAVVIYLVVQSFVVQTFQVQQVSMVPTIQPGEHLLVDKLTPRFDSYSRGDVVVFRAPGTADDETPFIKRIIGVGGDRVELEGGAVLVNGVALDESYISRGATEPDCGEDVWNVPQGELFLMGDHREQSQDSRCFGTVGEERVVGRAWLRFWPLDTLTVLPTPTYPDVPLAGG
ncbi:MAG: signal peptidase I [Chloroflexi bacterium]|nr:signal peptidase I [Chloroflexota bacterium]